MLSFSGSLKVYVALDPIDMRKGLEQGTFCWPRAAESGQTKLQLAPEAFALLTDGIDMHKATMRPWYERD
jgi:transposase